MTNSQRKEVRDLLNIIRGEINRMCIADELAELDTMYGHAKKHLDKLHKMIFESRFKISNDPDITYYDQIDELIMRGHHTKA